MNRAQRRKMRKAADTVAARFASACYDYTPKGRLVRVTHPRAVALLEKAFAHMLRTGAASHVVKLTQQDGSTFPRGTHNALPYPAPYWLAVGLDREGRGTYALEQIDIRGADAVTERRLAEAQVLARLARHTCYAGFPMPMAEGRA
jgi:hypothetical protein